MVSCAVLLEALVVGDRQLHRVDAGDRVRVVHVRAVGGVAVVELPMKLREVAVVGGRRAERDVLSAERRRGVVRKRSRRTFRRCRSRKLPCDSHSCEQHRES